MNGQPRVMVKTAKNQLCFQIAPKCHIPNLVIILYKPCIYVLIRIGCQVRSGVWACSMWPSTLTGPLRYLNGESVHHSRVQFHQQWVGSLPNFTGEKVFHSWVQFYQGSVGRFLEVHTGNSARSYPRMGALSPHRAPPGGRPLLKTLKLQLYPARTRRTLVNLWLQDEQTCKSIPPRHIAMLYPGIDAQAQVEPLLGSAWTSEDFHEFDKVPHLKTL